MSTKQTADPTCVIWDNAQNKGLNTNQTTAPVNVI